MNASDVRSFVVLRETERQYLNLFPHRRAQRPVCYGFRTFQLNCFQVMIQIAPIKRVSFPKPEEEVSDVSDTASIFSDDARIFFVEEPDPESSLALDDSCCLAPHEEFDERELSHTPLAHFDLYADWEVFLDDLHQTKPFIGPLKPFIGPRLLIGPREPEKKSCFCPPPRRTLSCPNLFVANKKEENIKKPNFLRATVCWAGVSGSVWSAGSPSEDTLGFLHDVISPFGEYFFVGKVCPGVGAATIVLRNVSENKASWEGGTELRRVFGSGWGSGDGVGEVGEVAYDEYFGVELNFCCKEKDRETERVSCWTLCTKEGIRFGPLIVVEG